MRAFQGGARPIVLGAVVFTVLVSAGWAARALRPPEPALEGRRNFTLPDVTVVNAGEGRHAGANLRVEDDRIESLRARGDVSPDLRRFAGATVVPGLIDMHVHYWSAHPEAFGLLLLAHGVTTVRDTGDSEAAIFDTRRRIETGETPGPRIFACGPILDGDPPVWPGSPRLRDGVTAREAVRRLAEAGADCVKIYHGLSAETLAAVREAAAAEGLPVVGHVPEATPLERSGLDDVQHLTGVTPPGPPTAPQRERVRAETAAWRSLDEDRVEEVVRTSVEHDIAHTPTLVFWERFFRLSGAEAVGDRWARVLPRYHRERFWKPDRPWNRTAEDETALADRFHRMKKVVRRLHEAGARIHAGSDTLNPFVVPGASLHEELRHLVDAGLSPEDAWAAATRVAAESLGQHDLGVIREGVDADFLVFREDPTTSLEALGTLEAVVSRGRLYTIDALRRELDRYRRHVESPVYDAISTTLARLGTGLGLTGRHL